MTKWHAQGPAQREREKRDLENESDSWQREKRKLDSSIVFHTEKCCPCPDASAQSSDNGQKQTCTKPTAWLNIGLQDCTKCSHLSRNSKRVSSPHFEHNGPWASPVGIQRLWNQSSKADLHLVEPKAQALRTRSCCSSRGSNLMSGFLKQELADVCISEILVLHPSSCYLLVGWCPFRALTHSLCSASCSSFSKAMRQSITQSIS